MDTQGKIKKIAGLLNSFYGRPGRLKKTDPVDVLVRTILSQNTTDKNSLKAFGALKANFNSWGELLKVDSRKLVRLIRHAGLANIKANRIRQALEEIEAREGRISLSALKKISVKDSLGYLRSLEGVGPKTAACVLLFGFGKPAMPVDTHVFRVTKRLGMIDSMLKIEEAHEVLSGMVPKHLIYEFHLGIIEHGRKTCKAILPRCGLCVLYRMCKFKYKALYKHKGDKI